MATLIEKRDYATLFIGLGGTGKDMLLAIKKKFREHLICDAETGYPRRTAFLELDADDSLCGPGKEITNPEYINLTVPNTDDILNPKNRHLLPGYEQEWLNPDIPPDVITVGAGGIRQIGRLQLSRHANELKAKFTNALSQNIKVEAGQGNVKKKIDVVICAGLAGGTGSGTFLDVAFLVQTWLKRDYPNYEMKVYGFFALPDVYFGDPKFADLFRNTGKPELMKANAYAAMKELDYWMQPINNSSKMSFEQEYAGGVKAKWDGRPLDIAFLLDNKRMSGTPIEDPYRHIVDKVAEMMLYCYADEAGAEFTFDSFMSNVAVSLTTINHGRDRDLPVNYSFASLGVSSTEAVERMVSAYETGLVIGRVLRTPKLDPTTAQLVGDDVDLIDHGIAKVKPSVYYDIPKKVQEAHQRIFGAQLIFQETQTEDQAFDILVNSEQNAYDQICRFTAADRTKEQIQGATEALFEESITRAVGDVNTQNSWEYNAKQKADQLLADEWDNFEKEAKDAICNLAIGPQGWLDYVKDKLIPRINYLLDKWKGHQTNGAQAYNSAVEAAKRQSESIRNFGVAEKIQYTADILGFAKKQLDTYASHEIMAVKGRRKVSFATKRLEGLEELKRRICSYTERLDYMLAALKTIAENSNAQLDELDAGNRLVSKKQLENYFQNQAQKDMAVAQTQSAIWNQLAEKSFQGKFVNGPGTTAVQQEEDRQALRHLVLSFLENVTEALQMNNMDWIINALEPDVTKQSDYVQQTICVNLDQAAEPMLPEIQSNDSAAVLATETRYLTVPANAASWVAGFQQYNNTVGGGYVKASYISDRVLWLKIRLGISAAHVLDTASLQASYEELISTPMGAGVHLYNSIHAKKYTSSWLSRTSWCLLPNLIPNALLHTDGSTLTEREKTNWEEAQKIFRSAVNADLVTYDDANGEFQLSFMNVSMHHDDFRKLVDGIVDNGALQLSDRLKQLTEQIQAWQTLSEKIRYGQFYARAQTLMGVVKPLDGASAAEKEKYNAEQQEARTLLCTYMTTLYPNYLEKLQLQLKNMDYFTKRRRDLQEMIENEKQMQDVFKTFARMMVCGKFKLDFGVFTMDCDSGTEELFGLELASIDENLRDLSQKERGELRDKYWQALMLLQLTRNPSCIPPAKKRMLEFEQGKFAGSLRDFYRGHSAEYETYKNNIDQAIESYRRIVGVAGKQMSEIDRITYLEDDEWASLRNLLKIPYRAMLEQLLTDSDGMM